MAVMVGLGEVLWDIFPSGEKLLGGAPANFAFHAHQLGDQGVVVSRVGEDELGQEILAELERRGLRTDMIQTDGAAPTGTVHVTENADGSHGFLITPNVAWDRLVASRSLTQLMAGADVVCFGTLAQRTEANHATIQMLLGHAPGTKLFDINFRQDYWSSDVIVEGLKACQIVKFSEEELDVLRGLKLVPHETNARAWCRALLRRYDIDLAAVTRGADGAMLLTRTDCVEEPGIKVDVADSVGCGDAFSAAMAHGWQASMNLQELAELANRVGAYVASQSGAMPALPQEFREV